VLSGPGGAGKGTVVERLVAADPSLWLSRSWTTRERRTGESEGSYVFVDREAFERHIAAGGFLEWTDFLGNYYGTPSPTAPDGCDVVLEIELDGARQVQALEPEAVVILLEPPSPDVQAARLAGRGERPEDVERRLTKGREELRLGRAMTDLIVVNDDLDQAVAQVAGIVEAARASRRGARPEEVS
jgi:guanylate kinase